MNNTSGFEDEIIKSLQMQHAQNNLAFEDYITHLEVSYLRPRNVGLRKFAAMTDIEKSRLKRILHGKLYPTDSEIHKIREAVQQIESKYMRFKS